MTAADSSPSLASRTPSEITIAANHGEFGGGEVMLMAIATAARELGHDVTVVAPDQPTAVVEAATKAGFRTIAIHAADRKQYLAGLRRWDRQERRGWLWCNGPVPALATAGHPRRVLHYHQLPHGLQWAAYPLATRNADRVLVPSADMQRALPGSQVLWNWTNDVAAVRRRDAETATPVKVGFIGRPSPDKGVLVLAAAIDELNRRDPGSFRLVLAGEPRFVSDADRQLVEQALSDIAAHVDRLGWVSRDDFFSSIDLAVFPSVWAEPFGLVAAEAMAARVPFVISDAGALPEVAGPAHPWVAKAGDAHELAEVLTAAAAADAGEQTAQARRRWEENFSPSQGKARLAKILRELS